MRSLVAIASLVFLVACDNEWTPHNFFPYDIGIAACGTWEGSTTTGGVYDGWNLFGASASTLGSVRLEFLGPGVAPNGDPLDGYVTVGSYYGPSVVGPPQCGWGSFDIATWVQNANHVDFTSGTGKYVGKLMIADACSEKNFENGTLCAGQLGFDNLQPVIAGWVTDVTWGESGGTPRTCPQRYHFVARPQVPLSDPGC